MKLFHLILAGGLEPDGGQTVIPHSLLGFFRRGILKSLLLGRGLKHAPVAEGLFTNMIQFFIAILLFAGSEQGQVEITADKQERDKNIFRYTGNVLATYQDMRVEAGIITYDETTKELTAGDHVRFVRGEEHLEADHITLNVETKASILTNAKGELGPGLFITAAEAQRSEDGRYYLKNATITTCDGPRPGWTLALARAVLDTNKQVTARNSIFRLESVPLFYLPYVMVPTSDRARSTGFLIPSTSSSTAKGRSLREEFFWAINRSADATFTGEYFSLRGPAGAIDFIKYPCTVAGKRFIEATGFKPLFTLDETFASVR